jgi:hypothetical protein
MKNSATHRICFNKDAKANDEEYTACVGWTIWALAKFYHIEHKEIASELDISPDVLCKWEENGKGTSAGVVRHLEEYLQLKRFSIYEIADCYLACFRQNISSLEFVKNFEQLFGPSLREKFSHEDGLYLMTKISDVRSRVSEKKIRNPNFT